MKKNLITALSASLIIAFSGINYIAMAKQYPLTITATANATANVAEIRISGIIHQWQNSSAQFKQEIDALIAKGITEVKLYINSPGGSVFEANEIANEIKRFKGKITGFGGAIVASAATYLALICDSFEMAENGQWMYHKPSGVIQGNEDTIASQLKLLQNFTNQYRKTYAAKTGMTEDEVEEKWKGGDVWLTAQEALKAKFITSISSTEEQITEDTKAMFVACGSPNIPDVKSKDTDMKNRNQIIAALKLPADATDEQIEQAVIKAQKTADTVETNKQALEDAAKIKAEALVDGGIAAKKIDADKRDSWVANATANYEGTKSIIDGIPEPSKASSQLNPNASAKTGQENWTMQDYLDKDPQALSALEKSDPEKFVALNEAYYGISLK